MPPILNAKELSKSFGAAPLFQNVSFIVNERDRIGLIGPNGSGKSTLLRILGGTVDADSGEVALRKRTRMSYVEQESQFEPGATVRSVVRNALSRTDLDDGERDTIFAETLGRAGFTDTDAEAVALSGGWRKRLAIVEALVQSPDILLLDEPTNHLDLAGIEWLENLLQSAQFAAIVVSHDRYFLENIATEMAELNRAYPDGVLRVSGNYSQFLEKKEQFLHAQAKRQESLENRVHSEIEWLRRGAKARTRKSKARIDKAFEMMGELADLNERTRTTSARIDFSATDRQTKRLIEIKNLSYGYEGRALFQNLDFAVTAGMRVGLVGPNGSGKTTLLRLLRGDMQPATGEVKRAEQLRLVYFDQDRELDENKTLRQALAAHGDSVIYQDRVVHVASWAARFLFTNEQLNQPVSRLSGGERARVLIAQLMLQPADVLLLDEPTNDLDIPTLEILEESLLEFTGALILVTHDRYMLDRVSTIVVGLDGQGGADAFADYSQWDQWQQERARIAQAKVENTSSSKQEAQPSAAPKKKLPYLEAREYASLETRIADAERALSEKQAAANDPAIATEADKLMRAHEEVEQAQKEVDALFARWAELEEKLQ